MSKAPICVAKELGILLSLTVLSHVLILGLIFPGYYRPLSPHHSDFYIAAALAFSRLSFIEYLSFPRPFGYLFAGATGHLGINGSIVPVIAVIFISISLVATILRRGLNLTFDGKFLCGFTIYTIPIFAHPYFYTFATYDVLAQLSLLLLVLATAFILQTRKRTFFSSGIFLAFTLSTCAFLSKETYALSAVVMAMLVSAIQWQRHRVIDLRLCAVFLMAFGLAMALNYFNESIFTGGANYAGSPYDVDLSPIMLIQEWWQYADDGLSGIMAIMLLSLIGFLVLISKRVEIRLAAVFLSFAGALVNAGSNFPECAGVKFPTSRVRRSAVHVIGASVFWGPAATFRRRWWGDGCM